MFTQLIKVALIAIACGAGLSLLFPTNNPIFNYAAYRSGWVMGGGMLLVLLNNAAVIFLALFGGMLFSLMEIKSYGTFPRRLYDFMDKLSFPLHFLFGLFDPRIKGLKNPMKACYFLSVSMPVMILFVNVLMFSALLIYGFMELNMKTGALFNLIPLAMAEFACIFTASKAALGFTRKKFQLYAKNDIDSFKKRGSEFLKSRKNWQIYVCLVMFLAIAAFVEVNLMV